MSAMKRFIVCLSLTLTLALGCVAQNPTSSKCPLSAQVVDDTASGKLQIIAIPTLTNTYVWINGVRTLNPNAPTIHICSIKAAIIQTSTAANYGLVTGTGTNCATGSVNLTPQWVGTISVREIWDQPLGDQAGLVAPSGTAICWNLSAAPTHSQVLLTYGIW